MARAEDISSLICFPSACLLGHGDHKGGDPTGLNLSLSTGQSFKEKGKTSEEGCPSQGTKLTLWF